MSKLPPAINGTTSGSMRIGPFWKRTDVAPMGDEPFDALTDLFLGEVGAGRAGKPPTGREAGATPAPSTSDGHVLRLTGNDGDDEYQLAPPPLAASIGGVIPTMPSTPVLTLDRDEDEDEGEGEARPIAGVLPPPARNAVLELLVLSNLPVLAGAWASQYVREIAEAAGKPVAYLRMQGEFAALEIVGALADVAGAPRPEDLGSLEAAIDAAAELTDRWIVRCDPGQEAPVIASTIARAVTVLTGTDQMARAACEKTLLALVTQLPASADDGPMVRLAMMGSGGEESRAAGPEFAAMAAVTLGRPVATIACAGRIGGVRPAHPLFGGPTELTLGTLVKSVERALVAEQVSERIFGTGTAAVGHATPIEVVRDEVEEFATRAPTPAIETETRVSAEELISLADVGAATEMAEIPLPELKPTVAEIAAGFAVSEPEIVKVAPVGVAAIAAVQTVSPNASPAQSRVESGQVGVRGHVRISPDASVATPRAGELPVPPGRPSGLASLASHLADLRSTVLKCPYAEGIEIAIDGAGALHLLARSHSKTTDDAALAELLVASSWTESHGALLAPAIGAPTIARPTLHLFTDRPKATRRLLETDVRVHLLAEVRVGEERGWYFADLN